MRARSGSGGYARSAARSAAGTLAVAGVIAACGSPGPSVPFALASDGGTSPVSMGGEDSGTSSSIPPLSTPEAGGGGGDANSEQPATCAEAANDKSYVGCEFWPTVVFNPVWSVFDFAAVVANASSQPAQISVNRGGTSVATATIAPGAIAPIILPWVADLKGGDFDDATNGSRPIASVLVPGRRVPPDEHGAGDRVAVQPARVRGRRQQVPIPARARPTAMGSTACRCATTLRSSSRPPR